MKKILISIMLLISIVLFSYGTQNVATRYFNVECEEQWQTNTILIEDDNTIIYSISLINQLGVYKEWGSSGNIVIIDSTATSARFYSNGPLKGRIYYYFDDDPLASCQCGLGSVSLDVYKHFDAAGKYGVEIIGPDCIADGDSVVFSINPILTGNLYSGIGMDLYNWNIFDAISAPYVQSIPYVSGDSSSVTFKVGAMTGNDSITVRVGMANEEYRIVKYLGKAAPKPVVNDTCLPSNQSEFEVNVYNENYPDLIYDWTWSTNWQIQYIENLHKSRVRLSTKIIGTEGSFSVTSSYPEQNSECTTASKASFNLTRSWGENSYITPIDTVVANNCDFIELELKDAYLSENAYPTWEKPNTWESEGDEHHSTFKARPINSTSDIDSIIVWEDVCNHRDSAKVYVYIKPAQVDSISNYGCLIPNSSYTFRAERLKIGPTPTEYEWFINGVSVPNEKSNSYTTTVNSSKTSISVVTKNRYGYTSDTTTLQLLYKPVTPTSIVHSNSCIAYNMPDIDTLTVTGIEPNQYYEWEVPATLNPDYLDNRKTSVKISTDGQAGSYNIKVWGTDEGICGNSDTIETYVNIVALQAHIDLYALPVGNYYYITPIIGYDASSFQWKFFVDGEETNALYSTTASMVNFQSNTYENLGDFSNSDTYTLMCEVTYTNGCKGLFTYGADIDVSNINLNATSPKQQVQARRINTNNIRTIQLYPNPTSSKLTIDINGKIQQQAELYIVDIKGQIIYSQMDFELGGMYDVSKLPRGQYVVCLRQGLEQYAEQFIKH